MTIAADQPRVSPPLVKLTLATVGATVVATLFGTGVSLAASAATVETGLLAGSATVLGVVFGLVVLAASGPKPPVSFAMVWVAASTVRAGAALGVGVWFYLMFTPEQVAFWGTLLLGAAAALAADVVVVVPRMRASGTDAGSERKHC